MIVFATEFIPLSLLSIGDNGYVRKKLVARKENCAEYWLKELQESIGGCTGHSDMTEILLKTTLNTIPLFNQSPLRR